MTSKERNLLFIVVSIILVVLFWFFLYSPIKSDIVLKTTEINALNTELNQLTLEYVQKDKYLDDINNMSDYIEQVNGRFPAFVNQEMIINMLIKLEDDIETLQIPSYSMTMPLSIISNGEYVDEASGEVRYNENLVETKASIDVSLSYEDMKKMLAFIERYDSKLSIEGLQMSSNLTEDTVSISFDLNFYALVSEERPFIPEDYFGPFEPKEDSIFKPYEGYGIDFDAGDAEGEISEPNDVIVILSSIYADRSTIITYKKDDSNSESYLYKDGNSMEPLEITFEQNGDTYFVKYKTSSGSYPSDYTSSSEIELGQQIDLYVFSTPRIDQEDFSGVNVTINNYTDLPMKIVITADDSDTPRFNIVSQTGEMSITRKAY